MPLAKISAMAILQPCGCMTIFIRGRTLIFNIQSDSYAKAGENPDQPVTDAINKRDSAAARRVFDPMTKMTRVKDTSVETARHG